MNRPPHACQPPVSAIYLAPIGTPPPADATSVLGAPWQTLSSTPVGRTGTTWRCHCWRLWVIRTDSAPSYSEYTHTLVSYWAPADPIARWRHQASSPAVQALARMRAVGTDPAASVAISLVVVAAAIRLARDLLDHGVPYPVRLAYGITSTVALFRAVPWLLRKGFHGIRTTSQNG
jgi:hypothetical protein